MAELLNCKNCIHDCYTEGFCEVQEICNFFIDKRNYVEVVRCKDCKHFTTGIAVGMCKRNPEKPIIPIPYNHFCSFGERKDNEA